MKIPKRTTRVGKRTAYTEVDIGDGRKARVPTHMAKRLRRKLGLERKREARSPTVSAWSFILPE